MGLKRGKPCSVYFLRPVGMAGPVKIGCSIMPEKRLREIMHWSPVALEIILMVPATQALEAELHARFADLRSHGEWFHADPRLDAAIAELRAANMAGAA